MVDKEKIQDEISALENRIDELKNNPSNFVDGKISDLEKDIERTKERSADGDDISMNQHLKYLRRAWVEVPGKLVNQRINRLKDRKNRLEERVR